MLKPYVHVAAPAHKQAEEREDEYDSSRSQVETSQSLQVMTAISIKFDTGIQYSRDHQNAP